MADCGAVGSALDRTAGGASSSASVGAISSFLENVANSTTHFQTHPGVMMPAKPPETLPIIHEQQRQQQHFITESHEQKSVNSGITNMIVNHNRMKEIDQAWMDSARSAPVGCAINSVPPQAMMLNQPGLNTLASQHLQTQMQVNMNLEIQIRQRMFVQMQAQQQLLQMQYANQSQQQQSPPVTAKNDVKTNIQDEWLEEVWNDSETKIPHGTQAHERNGEFTDVDVGVQQQHRGDRMWYEDIEKDAQAELGRIGSEDIETIYDGTTMEKIAEAWAEAEKGEWDNPLNPSTTLSPQTSPYQFHPDSSNLELPQDYPNFMEQGLAFFQAGKIQTAVLSFEAELQNNSPDNAEAWHMLGLCHAEHDLDVKAISCLERAVERDPYLLDALLALGVSYVNELDHARALTNLKAWVQHNPKYAGMDIQEQEDIYGGSSEIEQVQSLLLNALEWGSKEGPDAEVLEALGVCYNVSRDYDAAVESLTKAVKMKPSNHQLWNKLGATLANSERSEEAMPAYHEAIKLKPRYARAWLNMAISHSNLQNYDEAARCYLQTLSLNQEAVHCWSYLRIALTCAERWDMLPYVASQNIEELRKHFDFVEYGKE